MKLNNLELEFDEITIGSPEFRKYNKPDHIGWIQYNSVY